MDQFSEDDKKQVISLLGDAYTSRVNNLSRSVELAEEALLISRQIDDKELIGKSLSHLSLFYMIMGEYKRSMSVSEEAIKYFKEVNDERGVADIKYTLAGIYYKTDNFHLGLIYLIDCLIIYRKFQDYHNQARVQKSLGTIYEYFSDQKNAIKSYESSIEAAIIAGDTNLESNAYNPLSGIYLKQNEIKKALDIIERAISMKEQSGDIRGLAFALYGRAKIYTRTKQFREAEDDFKKALDIHLEMGEKLGTAMTYRKMGVLYMEIGQSKKAKFFLKKAIEVSDIYNIAITRFKSNYLLYQIYKQENDPIKSLTYLERYLEQKETVINAQTLQVIENYEMITKMESLEKEAQLQKEKAEIIEKKNLAEQAFKVRQEFLSTMSHEIRTPLNAVIMISSLLKDKADEEEKQLLNSLKFAANNLLLIINDILDFTKLDSGKANLEVRPGNLALLLENIKNTYENLAKEKGLGVSLTIDNSIAEFYELDETKVSQILGNLISNAIKYTEEGDIRIEIEKMDGDQYYDRLKFKISDTGVGISESDMDKIFEAFAQPHLITTRKQGGSGLGLAIVKKLADLHDSTVHVNSVVGKGSVFYFELKLKKSASPDKVPEKYSNQLVGKNALLAEDNIINAMVTTKLLSKWGITTVHAKNGLEVIEKSRLKEFDFILMDIHMPEMNGFDATKHIRQNESFNAKSPIFALTADITAQHIEEYSPYFNGFLSKPIEVSKLYEALINAV